MSLSLDFSLITRPHVPQLVNHTPYFIAYAQNALLCGKYYNKIFLYKVRGKSDKSDKTSALTASKVYHGRSNQVEGGTADAAAPQLQGEGVGGGCSPPTHSVDGYILSKV